MNDDTDRIYRETCRAHGHDPLTEAAVVAEAEDVARQAVAS